MRHYGLGPGRRQPLLKAFAESTYWPFHALRGPASGAGRIDNEDWDVYLCTLDKLTKAEFARCYCPNG